MKNKFKSLFPALYEINKIIIERNCVSRDYLAEYFGVSKRTITNYINVLISFGAPIKSSKKGYEYEIPFTIEPLNYEVMIFYSFLKNILKTSVYIPEFVSDLLLDHFNSFFSKEDFLNISDFIEYDFKMFNIIKNNFFQKILHSLVIKKKIKIDYLHGNGEREKVIIQTIKLYNYSGIWYIIAYREDMIIRLYNLSRISGLEITDKTFEKELESREIDDILDNSFGVYKSNCKGNEEKKVGIRFYDIAYNMNKDVVFYENQIRVFGKDNNRGEFVEFHFVVRNYTEVLGLVMQYSSNAEVLFPDEFRNLWLDRIREMAELYL